VTSLGPCTLPGNGGTLVRNPWCRLVWLPCACLRASFVGIVPTHGWMARLSWPGWLVTNEMVTRMHSVTHPSTNRAQYRATSFILRQTATFDALIYYNKQPMGSDTQLMLRGESKYRVVQKKIAQSLIHRHFATVCSRIMWFSPECWEEISVYQSMQNLYQLVKYFLINSHGRPQAWARGGTCPRLEML